MLVYRQLSSSEIIENSRQSNQYMRLFLHIKNNLLTKNMVSLNYLNKIELKCDYINDYMVDKV